MTDMTELCKEYYYSNTSVNRLAIKYKVNKNTLYWFMNYALIYTNRELWILCMLKRYYAKLKKEITPEVEQYYINLFNFNCIYFTYAGEKYIIRDKNNNFSNHKTFEEIVKYLESING